MGIRPDPQRRVSTEIDYNRLMGNKLAFVLSGGGSRGALQVGALHALYETGLQPDLLVGTSIGAVNSTFLALKGFSESALEGLDEAWRQVAELDLLPANYIRLTVRAMLRRSSNSPSHRIRDFFVSQGITPELRFGDLQHTRLVVISSDLNSGQPVLHGEHPDDKVLDALLLSTALPPWVMPVKKQGRYLMDGGLVSNLPIEPALNLGAKKIIALDLMDRSENSSDISGFTSFLGKLYSSVEKRQVELELELAAARRVPTLYIPLARQLHVPLWDFHRYQELIIQGYEFTRQVLDEQRKLVKRLR
jgi:NTE family protein